MRSLFAALLALLLPVPAVAGDLPLGPESRDFDQIHLSLRVEPDLVAGEVRGSATLAFAPLVDRFLRLRLHAADLTVLSVRDGEGRALSFSAQDGVLGIDLAAPLAKGARAEVAIEYRARPKRGLYFHGPDRDGPETPLSLYSQGEGTDNRHWIPCYDEPDDRLTLDLVAVIPDELVSVGNGVREVRDLPGPTKEETWRMDSRLPTYLICLAVGPYETSRQTRDGVVVEVNAFPGRLPEAKHAFGATADMIAFFGEWIGTPYPYPRYAQTAVWDFLYGGMENSTATTMNQRLLHGPETRPCFSADSIVAHELAHQWFGDLLTCRTWHHIWLNEGFATYFADLWFEHAEGDEEFRVRRHEQNRGYLAKTPEPGKLGLTPDPRGDRPLELFGGKQYDRGAGILHMLRLELGDDVFRRAIGRFVKEHADSAVDTEDFRRSVEAEAGRDLAWFFSQWVYGAGYPVLRIEPKEEEGAVVLSVRQAQVREGGQGLFRVDLPVRLETTGGPVPIRLPIRLEEEEFRVAVPGKLLYVRADDGVWLLGRVELKQGFGAWERQARTDRDAVGRIEALRELARFGDRGMPATSAAATADRCFAVRVAAAELLGARDGDRDALAALLSAAVDDDARVRVAAFEGLGRFDRDGAGEAVLRAIREETHPYVRSAAARALGRLHVRGAYDLLADLLHEPSHREVVRQGALRGFADLGDRRAAALAVPFLAYRWGLGAQSAMRHSALETLLRLAPDDRETEAAVVSLLDDPYFRMRQWAAEACGRYGYRTAKERLARMAAEDPDPGARGAARKAGEDLAR